MKFYQLLCDLGIFLNLVVLVCVTRSEPVNLSKLSFQDRRLQYELFHRKHTKRGHWKKMPALKKLYCGVLEKYASLIQKLSGNEAMHAVAGSNWPERYRYKREVRDDTQYHVYGKVVRREKLEANPLRKLFRSHNSRTKRGLRSYSGTKKLTEKLLEIMELTHRLHHKDNTHDRILDPDGSGDGEVGPTDIVISTTTNNKGTESTESVESSNHSSLRAAAASKKNNPHLSHCDDSYKHYCFNGGTCFQVVALNQISCRCPEGFTGMRCQEHINQSVLQVLEYGMFIGAAGIENVARACGKPEYAYLGYYSSQ